MYFSHAFRKTLLGVDSSSTIAVASGTSTATSALTAGQFGIYSSSFLQLDFTTSTTGNFYIVQGSYYTNDSIGSHGGYKESVKSKMINPKYISRIFTVAAKAPVQQVVQIPVSCGLTCDTTYRLRIDVKGSPALRFLSHNIYRVLDSYTGCCSTTNPTYVKDPVATIVDWKEQINSSAYFNQLVQARAYAYRATPYVTFGTPGAGTAPATVGTVVATISAANNTTGSIFVGQRVTGGGLPVNSFVTALTTGTTRTAGGGTWSTGTTSATYSGATLTGFIIANIPVGTPVTGLGIPAGAYVSAGSGTTSITITYPTQTTAPSIGNAVIVTPLTSFTISYPYQSGGAPTLTDSSATNNIKLYNDLYGANGGTTTFFNTIVGNAVQPTYVGQATYIPGTNTQAVPAGTPTSATVGAAATVAASGSGAHVLVPQADAASFSADCFLELTAAYVETKFGNCTFTVTDNYDLEPLKIIASVMDDAGDPCLTTCIGSSPSIGVAGIATVVQNFQQAQGVGETIVREMILTGRYRQEAFGDGVNIDTFRMREIEANPGVLNMLSTANRNGLYNKLCILHNVPRFNNPTGVFDNDQYLIEIAVPNTVAVTELLSNLPSGGSKIGDFIWKSANAVGNVLPVERF